MTLWVLLSGVVLAVVTIIVERMVVLAPVTMMILPMRSEMSSTSKVSCGGKVSLIQDKSPLTTITTRRWAL